MIQNVIIKLKDYLVVTNIWGLCMMPDAFSKIHDVWCVLNDAWCIFHDKWCILHDKWCILHDKWCILHNAPNIHKFEDYLVLTNMWDTFMICDALSKIHDAWCTLHDVWCIIHQGRRLSNSNQYVGCMHEVWFILQDAWCTFHYVREACMMCDAFVKILDVCCLMYLT